MKAALPLSKLVSHGTVKGGQISQMEKRGRHNVLGLRTVTRSIGSLNNDFCVDRFRLGILADHVGALNQVPPCLVAVGRQKALLDSKHSSRTLEGLTRSDEHTVSGPEVGERSCSRFILGDAVVSDTERSVYREGSSIGVVKVLLFNKWSESGVDSSFGLVWAHIYRRRSCEANKGQKGRRVLHLRKLARCLC